MADLMEEQIAKLKAENDEMEKAILSMTASSAEATKPLAATKVPEATGIQVLNFGGERGGQANEAGKDHGSSWCPPQCSRRTVLGGFFTS